MSILSFSVLLAAMMIPSLQAAPAASAGMGKGLYGVEGANSCMFCHGISGEGGKVKEAAKLTHPKQWKAYAALGGDASYKKDPKVFLEKMKAATLDLIKMGAIRHNATYKAEGYNKAAIKPYSAQMMGLSGSASIAWLKKYSDKGVTPDVAAESLWLHVQILDQEAFFKN